MWAKCKKGRSGSDRGQSGCEPRIELIVKMQKSWEVGAVRGGGGQGGCDRRMEVIVKMQKNVGGGRSGRGGVVGVRSGGGQVDVNVELKLL